MLPNTSVKVTVIGKQHFGILQIPRSSLHSLPFAYTLTVDGSEMSPALRCFKATLRLGQKSCAIQIQVHQGVQTPLFSYAHCKKLAIISQELPKPILYGQTTVVPAALHRRTLAHLHNSHRGVEATRRRAKQTVFWPGIDSDIASTISACKPCQVLQHS